VNVLAVIPARGGSKGIKGKNLARLCGKPLIGYIIETARAVTEIDRVIVSTDDAHIAQVAKDYGAEVPFIRPSELAADETPTLPVLQHALRYLEENEDCKPEIVVLLYATSPLIGPDRISAGIRMMKERHFDSVISVEEDRGHYWTETADGFRRFYPKVPANRQYAKPLYKENGAIYIATRDLLVERSEIVGGQTGFLIMKRGENIDIDDFVDLQIAECLLQKRAANSNDS